MGVLSLEAINPGMVLAGDVKDRNGRVLLSAGSEITERHLRIFKMWGILTVQVHGEEKEESPLPMTSAPDLEEIQRVEREVAELFCHHDLSHPFIKELFRLAIFERLSGLEGSNGGS